VKATAGYGSDVVVDLLRAAGIEYVALNPGATYRGLHDSLVNYGANKAPELVLTTHEEIAVAIAHGYAKARGAPMAAVVHDIVGLQHASMAIFNAFCDRAPSWSSAPPVPWTPHAGGRGSTGFTPRSSRARRSATT
jgi:thiamine pyrophosphate-dependent acetolactate synthase large subunit-like protein